MRIAVVGGGITGLFAAYYLRREGADVTLFEPEPLGARSAHAAGILEPLTAYRTNTVDFLRRVWHFWWRGTCAIRSVDARWLVESARQLERPAWPGAAETLRAMGRFSIAEYARMAQEADDFGYATRGLIERFDDPVHFAAERATALDNRAVAPVEVRAAPGGAGELFFPEVGWVHTERFVERIARELAGVSVVRHRAHAVATDGSVTAAIGGGRFDGVAVCTGVTSRSLGVPLTGVRGFGWHVRVDRPPDVATIDVDRGLAVVPFADEVKVTGGWVFDLGADRRPAARILEALRGMVEIREVLGFDDGSRPCTPDGLPTVGRRERLVVANGGFRLGWSFAPALGQAAARLALGQGETDPFLARFCGGLHSGRLG